MREDTCKLDVDGDGQCEYHGGFGGLAFLHQVGKRFSQLLETDLSKEIAICHLPLQRAFGSTSILMRGSGADPMTMFHLPSQAAARHSVRLPQRIHVF
jgi:hypothetical protein